MSNQQRKTFTISGVFPQINENCAAILFTNDPEMIDKILSMTEKYLAEKIPEESQLLWLINAALTGIYYRLMLEGVQS